MKPINFEGELELLDEDYEDEDLSQGQDDPNDECTCGHRRESHGEMGCYVFMGNFVGDCPCEEFDEFEDV
jgi:hypothetical protein